MIPPPCGQFKRGAGERAVLVGGYRRFGIVKRAPADALLPRVSRRVSENRAAPARAPAGRSSRSVFGPAFAGPSAAIRREPWKTAAVARARALAFTRAVTRQRPRTRARAIELMRARSLAGREVVVGLVVVVGRVVVACVVTDDVGVVVVVVVVWSARRKTARTIVTAPELNAQVGSVEQTLSQRSDVEPASAVAVGEVATRIGSTPSRRTDTRFRCPSPARFPSPVSPRGRGR